MPKYRILLSLVLALAIPSRVPAQEPSGPTAPVAAPAQGQAVPEVVAPPTAAEKTIDAAIAKVRAVSSVSADLELAADMLNQKFRLKGQYLKAPGFKVYLLLTLVGLGDTSGTMLQVCDGTTLWDFSRVLESQQCSRLTITPILKALDRPECDPKFREDILSGLGFAGPEALLTGLRKAFDFDQTAEGDYEGRPVWILRGKWKDNKTPVAPGGGPVSLGAPLPPYVPSLVTLTLGKDDGWPYQVLFEGRMPTQIEQRKKVEEPQLDASGRAIDKKITTPSGKPSKLVLTYSNLKVGVTIPEETFAFAPPKGLTPKDDTDRMVAQLEQVITDQANKKKADAAPAGPVIDGSLSAPSPGSEGAATLPGDAPK